MWPMHETTNLQNQIPAFPDPVAVNLTPSTTALLVMDMTEPTCGPQPNCLELLPRIGALAKRARAAGVFIAYTAGAAGGAVLPAVYPEPGDPVIIGSQNKFWSTTLDDQLRARRIATVVLAGWRANGSILYTSHGATNLRYTVVVPVDGTAAPEPFQVAIGFYQVLNLLSGNATNEPLKPNAVTLSRTDLITF